MKPRPWGRVAAALVTVSLLAAACGSDDDSSSDDAGADPPAATEDTADGEGATETSADDTATETTAPGGSESGECLAGGEPPAEPTGTLRYSVYSDTPSLDPRLISTTLGYFVYPAYDTLLILDDAFEPQPYLATSWEQVDDVTWELTLRDDVTFSDGEPFDANAVKATLESGAALDGSPASAFYDNIASVDVVEDHVARITLASPSASFLLDIARPPGAMISPAALADGVDLRRTTAGTGGWVYDPSASQEGSLHVWTANPDHWNSDAVHVERVEFHLIQDNNARLNAVEGGQVEIAGNITPAQRITARDAGLCLVELHVSHVRMMITDRGGDLVPALADQRVRQAIGHLINREAYNEAVLSGEGDPDNAGFLARSTPWFDESLNDVIPYDPERAKELLAEAGYEDGFTMQAPLVPSIQQQLETVAQMLAVGNIILEPVPVADGAVASSMREGLFPITYGTTHAIDPNTWWNSTVSGEGPYNPFGLTDVEDLDALADEAAATTDPERRRELAIEIQHQVIERGLQFTLSFIPATAAVADSVHGTPIMSPEETQPRPHGLWVD